MVHAVRAAGLRPGRRRIGFAVLGTSRNRWTSSLPSAILSRIGRQGFNEGAGWRRWRSGRDDTRSRNAGVRLVPGDGLDQRREAVEVVDAEAVVDRRVERRGRSRRWRPGPPGTSRSASSSPPRAPSSVSPVRRNFGHLVRGSTATAASRLSGLTVTADDEGPGDVRRVEARVDPVGQALRVPDAHAQARRQRGLAQRRVGEGAGQELRIARASASTGSSITTSALALSGIADRLLGRRRPAATGDLGSACPAGPPGREPLRGRPGSGPPSTSPTTTSCSVAAP